MWFARLRGLTALPLGSMERQFRNEEVHAVLPARVGMTAEALLVATPFALGIVISGHGVVQGPWMTRWAPWDIVRLSDGADPWTESDDDAYQLFVDVGGARFDSHLSGEDGRKLQRDFITAFRDRHAIPEPSSGA